MEDWLRYVFVLFMAVGTSRMAISKGRNPWIWGSGALILGLLGGAASLFSVGPMIILMFISKPTAKAPPMPGSSACPECGQARRATQHFCTNCGWDFNQPYSPDGAETVPFAEETAQDASRGPVTETELSPADSVVVQTADASPVSSEAPLGASSLEIESVNVEVKETDSAGTPDSKAEDAVSGEPARPWGIPEPGVAPTAAIMTNRGIERLNGGRIQEAIDQFTKAIALDPNYLEAWQLRAEAYSKQGRGVEAAEDLRRIKGLNASSSPG